MALIVETVVADSMAELVSLRDRETPADMVELRLDFVRDLDVDAALAGRGKPVIATCRAAWEGGAFQGSEDERLRVLARAVELGAEYVDVEWKAAARLVAQRRSPSKIVVSHHDFETTLDDLEDRVRAMCALGADVVKVAVHARTAADCTALKRSLEKAGPHVAIAMGNLGRFTRLWPAWSDSLWTYGGTAAPGQVSTSELDRLYRVRETTRDTQVFGVTGSPLGHTASPAMHNAAFAALGLDAVYLPFEARCAAEVFALSDAVGLAGASVTIPLKQALMTPQVSIDDLPSRVGALNTLRRTGSGWEGRNFDVAGFLAPLDARAIRLEARRAVVLGAGGAARAAVWALISRGAQVEIAARREEAARDLADALGAGIGTWPPRPGWDVLVNSTPSGMWPNVDESPLAEAALGGASGKVVYDLVYNPLDTRLLQLARAAGATTIGGLEMLVGQACLQFEWWTGRKAPRDVMSKAGRDFVKAQTL